MLVFMGHAKLVLSRRQEKISLNLQTLENGIPTKNVIYCNEQHFITTTTNQWANDNKPNE